MELLYTFNTSTSISRSLFLLLKQKTYFTLDYYH